MKRLFAVGLGALLALALSFAKADNAGAFFERVATFPVCLQFDEVCDTDIETAAEIVAASTDGNTLIYTDSPSEALGFVDIRNPMAPQALGTLALPGEPTSVAVKGGLALVAVNTSEDFIVVSGELLVVDIAQQRVIYRLPLGGQPDAIAVSPDGRYAAIAIENERDEDLGDGRPPQLPAGELLVVDLLGAPSEWSLRRVSLVGRADVFSGDPEPEYVAINERNIAVVTLQENNHIALVDLRRGRLIRDYSAGTVDLEGIDTEEESPAIIRFDASQRNVPREPDGVAWINSRFFATADEGDLDGGSRGFTVFRRGGRPVFSSGERLDYLAASIGHYPDDRSGNKGNEPENIAFGKFGDEPLLFVASERSSLIFVYDVRRPRHPALKQILPTAAAPEGVLTLPGRGLVVVASEEDDRGDGLRSSLNIYRYGAGFPAYPTLQAPLTEGEAPMAFGALSALAADREHSNILYSVDDSFYQRNRIFKIDTDARPAALVEAMVIRDASAVLANFPAVSVTEGLGEDHPDRANVFDTADRSALINDDLSVNIDPEGLAAASDGGFWLASEGSGTVGDARRPITKLNWVLKLDRLGQIEAVYTLPPELNAVQFRFGFEGIAERDGDVIVAFQRAWNDEPGARIGVLNPETGEWRFYFYPLDVPSSPAGGWVGISEIVSLAPGQFAVLERDNQAGPDARIKRVYQVSTNAPENSVLPKTLKRDLLQDLTRSGGLVPEKLEGLAWTADGRWYLVNDNDGVDDNSGEIQLIELPL